MEKQLVSNQGKDVKKRKLELVKVQGQKSKNETNTNKDAELVGSKESQGARQESVHSKKAKTTEKGTCDWKTIVIGSCY